jgi:hypothetical protein
LRFDEDTFWNLMACSPTGAQDGAGATWRSALQSHMAEAAHREKLISLGTLAAGPDA